MTPTQILLVTDQTSLAAKVTTLLEGATGLDLEIGSWLGTNFRELKPRVFAVVIADLSNEPADDAAGKTEPSGTQSMGLVERIKLNLPGTPVVKITGPTDPESVSLKALPALTQAGQGDFTAECFLRNDQLTTPLLLQSILSVLRESSLMRRVSELEKQLEHSQQAQESAARFKPKFLAEMSHELKTPMNAVVGLTDLLRRSPLNPEQLKLVEIIQHSGKVLLDVINDVLTFSQIESGKFDLQTQVFDLGKVVESAVEGLSEKAREKNIYLTTFISPELPALVNGDPQRLRQVFLNLIFNTIQLKHAGKLEVKVSCDRRGESLTVKTNIIFSAHNFVAARTFPDLIPPELQDALKVEDQSAAGLAWEVTSRIVDFMKGTISVKSHGEEDLEIIFIVRLTEASTSLIYEKNTRSLQQSRILLGNLQQLDSDTLRKYADAIGTRCDSASSSKEILNLIEKGEQEGTAYHLLVLDLQSPDSETLNGDTLATLVRKDLALAVIRPYEEVASVEKLYELKIARRLCRPLNQSQLINCLAETFNAETDAPNLANETQFVDSLLKNSGFDLSQRVLVVEDNQVNREVAKLQLKTLGINPVLVSSGTQALEEIVRTHYPFIFMDCQMPKMDGYDTTRSIRRLEASTKDGDRSTIIALTANAMPGDREKCLEAGMDDFISKPVTVEKLGHTLLKWQQNRRESLVQVSHAPDPSETDDFAPPIESSMNLNAIKQKLVTTYGEVPGGAIFDLFCSTTPELIKQMEKACTNKDWKALSQSAHDLKGQCSMVHANELATLCKEIESVINSKEREEVPVLLNKLRRSYEKARIN